MQPKFTEPADRPKSPERIVNEQIEESLEEYNRSNRGLFFSALTAGLDLGFSLFLMSVLYTMFSDQFSDSKMQLVMAAAYPLGFIFVVLSRSALFTEHTTLAVLPVLDRRKPIKSLARIWAIIYGGNLVGGYMIGAILAWLGPRLDIISTHALEEIALHLVEVQGILIVGSAMLAGWLMGLLSWLVTSSQETISRIFIVILITIVIGIGGLHHCIVGSTEVFAGMLVSERISLFDYLSTQSLATLGNIIGGVFFVSILKFQVIQE